MKDVMNRIHLREHIVGSAFRHDMVRTPAVNLDDFRHLEEAGANGNPKPAPVESEFFTDLDSGGDAVVLSARRGGPENEQSQG
jgi:hypothetical protein